MELVCPRLGRGDISKSCPQCRARGPGSRGKVLCQLAGLRSSGFAHLPLHLEGLWPF